MSYDYNNIGEDLVIIFNGGALKTSGDSGARVEGWRDKGEGRVETRTQAAPPGVLLLRPTYQSVPVLTRR